MVLTLSVLGIWQSKRSLWTGTFGKAFMKGVGLELDFQALFREKAYAASGNNCEKRLLEVATSTVS